MKIVFMGTPDFAVPTLKALIENKHDVAAVFTQPDKPVGRKQILTSPPIKQVALENNIPVFQPTTLRDGTALEALKETNPDIIVVVAYGKILPEEILSLPKYGCVNGHASLLPRHRGASPIQWSIYCGDTVTGVTTMLMDIGMDTGDMLDTVSTDISADDTAQSLHDRLSLLGAQLMISTLKKIENGTVKPIKQDETKATYAPIIKKEMAQLDFNKSADTLVNEVRAFYGWPVAYFTLNGKRIKVHSATACKGDGSVATVIKADGELVISCGESTALSLQIIQPEGSKSMSAKEMLCGRKIEVGTKI